MDERAALAIVGAIVDAAGDDCAIVDELLVTTDMLHEETDFPPGTTQYTAGWRTVGASLSDIAAMGGEPTGAVAVYGAPTFESGRIESFLEGCLDVCHLVGTEYVGGDLDGHREFTVVSTALGRCEDPVLRSGASPGEALCVTGTVGRSAAAVEYFGEDDARANELFQFEPRIEAGRALAPFATAMMDSSDGLARSCHQLAEASDCGFAVKYDAIPVHPAVRAVATDLTTERDLSLFFGEDFELVCTIPEDEFEAARAASPVPIERVGTVTPVGVKMDGEPLPDRGYTH
ncbi:MAG: thiamine-phosphate kinase [Natronomonas sp.]